MNSKNPLNLKKGQKSYITSIVNQYKSRFDEKTKEAVTQAKEIKDFYNDLFNGTPENKGLVDKIASVELDIQFKATEISKKIEKLEAFYNSIFTSNDDELSIQEEIEKYLKDIDKSTKEFNDYCDIIFGPINEKGERIGGGLKTELENKRKEYETLNKKIEGLLPGATAAGLAYAYQSHKETFKWPKYIWQGIFVISLVLMILVITKYNPGIDRGDNIDPITQYLYSALLRITLLFPLIWLAVFASKQQSKAERLQQEYAYKEALSRSFEGYYREIEKLGESEHGERLAVSLLEKIIEMSGYNPSITLDNGNHDEKPPITGDIKDNISGIIGNISTKK